MANALYDKAREKFLKGEISWTDPNTNIKVVLVGPEYSPSLTRDEFFSDIPVAARIAVSSALTNKQATNGIASADNIVVANVSQGMTIRYIVLFKDTGSVLTSPLIAFIDTASGLNPQNGISTDTGNIQIQWDTGANRIFKI